MKFDGSGQLCDSEISIKNAVVWISNQCKRGYARSETYVCQQKVENRPKKRCSLKAPENYL